MKKNTFNLLALCLVLAFNSVVIEATAAVAPSSLHVMSLGEPTPGSTILINRIAEIKSLDKSGMSFREKRALRKELRSIKKELRVNSSGGIYISVGALLVVILLLILLL